ncbi:MAG: immunity 70 family protein [Lachnospiraceae bacterium]|nr:immunity 70 family protein [Lachnospiraceae bacterium]
MKIKTADMKRTIDVGESEIWYSVYSTSEKRVYQANNKVPLALSFFKTGRCETKDALETARQFNLLRDEFSKYPPEKAVYDMKYPEKRAPWANNISPVVTSCANLYTTTDGKDLLFEVVSILTYAYYAKTAVFVE